MVSFKAGHIAAKSKKHDIVLNIIINKPQLYGLMVRKLIILQKRIQGEAFGV